MSLTTNVLVPLTTVFTPPAGCLATATYNPSGIWAPSYSKSLSPAILYGATGQAPDLLCYPPKYTLNNVYSPGICPHGWTSACAPSGGSSTLLPAPTTGVQCCPSGFGCDDFDWCVQQAVATPVPVWSIYTDKWGIEGIMTSAAFPTMKARAKPIFVAYQSSDRELLASATLSSSSSGPTPTGSSDDSLSSGAIAGIAIGAAAGGILAAVLFFFSLWFCLGYRLRRERPGAMSSESQHELAAKETSTTSQLDSRQKLGQPQFSATELPSGRHTPADGTVELDTAATYGRSELAGTRETKS